MMSDEAIAWFLMTEGSLSVACRWRQKRTKLGSEAEARISNTDREMIKALRDGLDAHGIRYGLVETQLKNGPIYAVRVRGNALLTFLQVIRPYLIGVKARVADQVLAYFAITNRARTKISDRFEKWYKILDIVESLNRLNRKAVISREKHRLHMEEVRAFLEEKRSTTWRRQGKNCIGCGRFFPISPGRMPTARYCSRSCKYREMAQTRHYSMMAQSREARRMIAPNPDVYEDVPKSLEASTR